jgi:flagellar biosynthesis anti-sigma factor FlgM
VKIENFGIGAASTDGISNQTKTSRGISSNYNNIDSGDAAGAPQFAGLVSAGLDAGAADRAARVEQLRQMVADGTYKVDANALSSALVDSMFKGF